MRWVLSNFFIEAALGDDDGLAAGLGQGELERARDDARPQVQPGDGESSFCGRAGIEAVDITGGAITKIRKAGRVGSGLGQVNRCFYNVSTDLTNLVVAEDNSLFVSCFVSISIRGNAQITSVKARVIQDQKVGQAVKTAGGERLAVEQAAEGVGAGLRGRGQLVGGRNRGGVVLALAALREQQQGQVQREVGFYLNGGGGDALNVWAFSCTWATGGNGDVTGLMSCARWHPTTRQKRTPCLFLRHRIFGICMPNRIIQYHQNLLFQLKHVTYFRQ